MPVNS